jgi:hypothetical protein
MIFCIVLHCSWIVMAAWSGWSLIGTEAWEPYTLAPRNFLPSPPEDAAYWPDTQRTPLAKEGTNVIWPAIPQIFRRELGSFTCPKAGTWDRICYVPSEGRLRSGANPRSWVPEASMLTTRPLKPLGFGPRTVQPIASQYTDWATRPTSTISVLTILEANLSRWSALFKVIMLLLVRCRSHSAFQYLPIHHCLPNYVRRRFTLQQRFANCGLRTTSGPRVLPLWSS